MGNVSSVDSTITPDYIRKAVDQIRLDTPGPQQVKAFLNIYKVGIRSLNSVSKITESQLDTIGVKSVEQRRLLYLGIDAHPEAIPKAEADVPGDMNKFRAEIEGAHSPKKITARDDDDDENLSSFSSGSISSTSSSSSYYLPPSHSAPSISNTSSSSGTPKKPLPVPGLQVPQQTSPTGKSLPPAIPPKSPRAPQPNLPLPSSPPPAAPAPRIPRPSSPPPPSPSLASSVTQSMMQGKSADDAVGRGIAAVATNEQVQQQAGTYVSNYMSDQNNRQAIGKAIASNSDNAAVKALAGNQWVQDKVGAAAASAATNREIQKAAGTAVANAATNPEVRQKVASGASSVASTLFSGAKAGFNLLQ